MPVATPAFRYIRPPRASALPAASGETKQPGVNSLTYLSMMYFISMYEGALIPIIRWATNAGVMPVGDTDISSTISQALALCVVALWGAANLHRVPGILRALLPYLMIVGLCAVSALWSPYLLNTARRSVTLTVCVLYGAYLYDRLGLEGMVRMFARTSLCLAAMSIVAYFALPTLGRDTGLGYENAMRGVFAAKNTAGMGMLLALPCVLYLGSLPGANRFKAFCALLIVFLALVMTRSASSSMIGLVVTGIGLRLWLRSNAARLIWVSGILAVLVLIVATLLFWPDQIFPLIGRDASFTGRVPLWQECLILIAKRPFLGYGYSGFWNVDSRDVQYMWLVIDWEAPNAHDGYLDILLQIGIVGLIMYLFMWGTVTARAVRQARRGVPIARWVLLLMLVNILLNIDEGPLPYPDQFTLFVAASLLALWQMEHGTGATAPRRRALAVSWQPRPRLAAGFLPPAQRESSAGTPMLPARKAAPSALG